MEARRMKKMELPVPLQKTEMTFWSRCDPVRVFEGNTNHWAILRVRANKLAACKESAVFSQKNRAPAAGAARHESRRKDNKCRRRPNPQLLVNNYYQAAKENVCYWPYDKNDPFTYRPEPPKGRSLLTKNPA